MSSITFAVQGMSCGGCSGKVKRALEALEGVSATEVVLESGAVTVQYDEASVKPSRTWASTSFPEPGAIGIASVLCYTRGPITMCLPDECPEKIP
ncbi:heavy-metal-associated domain-containing protein [Stutzerimonas kirkiae]|uniref:heavy-metal-associated domain-containing protein n=1 Tax=Stutzerimonas kirkiae TaxID=2211392 RepID=UPI001A9550DA|nr:cation transporter [Stutzerimonas kirkiae]